MTAIPPRVRAAVYERDGHSCQRCGQFIGECGEYSIRSIQHRIKRSQGGTNHYGNLVTMCGNGTLGCHGWVEANPKAAQATGFAVPSWVGDPALVIMTRLDGTAFLINNHGNLTEVA